MHTDIGNLYPSLTLYFVDSDTGPKEPSVKVMHNYIEPIVDDLLMLSEPSKYVLSPCMIFWLLKKSIPSLLILFPVLWARGGGGV